MFGFLALPSIAVAREFSYASTMIRSIPLPSSSTVKSVVTVATAVLTSTDGVLTMSVTTGAVWSLWLLTTLNAYEPDGSGDQPDSSTEENVPQFVALSVRLTTQTVYAPPVVYFDRLMLAVWSTSRRWLTSRCQRPEPVRYG